MKWLLSEGYRWVGMCFAFGKRPDRGAIGWIQQPEDGVLWVGRYKLSDDKAEMFLWGVEE